MPLMKDQFSRLDQATIDTGADVDIGLRAHEREIKSASDEVDQLSASKVGHRSRGKVPR